MMPITNSLVERIALIATLAAKAPSGFGRTALMKCLYFLQTIRGVPLDYHFRLYNYGPFDPDVLSDLSLCERIGAVGSELQPFPGGYRYEIQRGSAAPRALQGAHQFLSRYEEDINWVISVFGGRRAVELENASTLIYIDRSIYDRASQITLDELVRKVHEVKPHLALHMIEREATSLKDQKLLVATV